MNLITQRSNAVCRNLKFIKLIFLTVVVCISYGCTDEQQSTKSSIQFRQAEVIEDKNAVLEEIKLLKKKSSHAFESEKQDEALPILKKMVVLQERLYGTKHGDVALSYSYIGMALSGMENYKQAKHYLERALAIVEAVYGLEEIETSISLNELGVVLLKMGHDKQAKHYFDRANAIDKIIRVRDTQYYGEQPK